jgi:hypothetical protein
MLLKLLNQLSKVILHLGPPKTATTALQYFLQAHQKPLVKYCGVHQPRNPQSHELSNRVLQYCQTGNALEKKLIRDELERLMQHYSYIIISEEMLLVHSKKTPVNKKLERLGFLFQGINITCLVTVRNPVEAIPSYYQELYKHLPPGIRGSFKEFCTSEYVIPYRYAELEKLLNREGLSSVKFLCFEKLTEGRYTIGYLLDNPKLTDAIVLNRVNEGKINKQNKARLLEDYSKPEKIVFTVKKKLFPFIKGTGIGSLLLKQLKTFRSYKTEDLIIPDFLLEDYKSFRNKVV